MKKNAIFQYKETAKELFYERYKCYIERFLHLGINVKYKAIAVKRRYILIEVTLKPVGISGKYYGRYFFAKILKIDPDAKNDGVETKKDIIFEKFLKRELKKAESSLSAPDCTENLSNFLLRLFFFPRLGMLPTKFKGRDIRVVYLVIDLIVFAILCFMAARIRIELNQTMGWNW